MFYDIILLNMYKNHSRLHNTLKSISKGRKDLPIFNDKIVPRSIFRFSLAEGSKSSFQKTSNRGQQRDPDFSSLTPKRNIPLLKQCLFFLTKTNKKLRQLLHIKSVTFLTKSLMPTDNKSRTVRNEATEVWRHLC